MIRFACPGCKRVLSGHDGYAGKTVTCPKCGTRMQVPRIAPSVDARRTASRRPKRNASRWPLVVGVLAVGVVLLGGAGTAIWLGMNSHEGEPAAVAVASEPSTQPASLPVPPPTHIKDKPSTPDSPSQPEPKPKQEQPTEKKPIDPNPSEEKPPPLPSPPARNTNETPLAQDKKTIDLADDTSPELEFQIVEAINIQRQKAKLEPIFLDAELSRGCQAHAEYLALNAARLGGKGVEQPDEELKWPGFSEAGRTSARTATSAAGAPLGVIEKWLAEPARREAILEPKLRTFTAGFARNVEGQWFSVFDWKRGIDSDPPLATTPVTGAIAYPAPGQRRVPLWFPGNEVPDPIPEARTKLAGYPITLMFPPRSRVESVRAQLSNKNAGDIAVWLSSPEKPANPQFSRSQQNTVCLIPKQPLHPLTRYHVEVEAKVNGQAWSAKWDFATVSAGEIHYEMAGTLLRTVNGLRRQAGLPPVALNAERSKICSTHAHYLGLNAPANPALNWNEEKADLPGYTAEGAAVARTSSIQGGGGPVEAVNGLMDSLISRPQMLDPQLREVGLGYTPFALGGWIWVMELRRAPGRETAGKEYLYPAPDQDDVPLFYPSSEVPSPIPPERKGQPAGFAITVSFAVTVPIKSATAKLRDDKDANLEGWLSTPDKPAIPGYHQRFLCFLPRDPLRPGTRYTVTFTANVGGRPWERTWRFTTIKEPDRFAPDMEERILAQVNAARQAAGLKLVRLDAELSRGCQSHARYLVLNQNRPEGQGLGVHQENPQLPGATPEGGKAAKEAVIAVLLDPQSCVPGWMATLYHRIPILAPNLERIGFGHAQLNGRKWACVLDTGNGRAPLASSGQRPR